MGPYWRNLDKVPGTGDPGVTVRKPTQLSNDRKVENNTLGCFTWRSTTEGYLKIKFLAYHFLIAADQTE